ncbi:MAG: ATP phosphoribosyltransferase regulatory subunit [Caulobacteraceae bacterium]
MRLEGAIPAAVLAAVRAPFAAAGGEAVATSAAEPLGLYLDLAGEALREQLFLVQGPGREECCLRPDFTLGVALSHIAGGAVEGRYVYEGPAFRVAHEQAEQFLQIGLEAYGPGDAPAADAAMALLAWRSASAGGRDDLSLVLGDVALFAAFVMALGVAPASAARLSAAYAHPTRLARELAATPAAAETGGVLAGLLADLDETRSAAVLEEIWSIAGIEPVGGRGPAEIVHRLSARAAAGPRLTDREREAIAAYLAIADAPAAAFARIAKLGSGAELDARLAAWERRLVALAAVPAERITFAAGLHRPFSYYDGAFFEVRSAALGDDVAVAAGGRYDILLARLGDDRTRGAVGCMVRPGLAWKDGQP